MHTTETKSTPKRGQPHPLFDPAGLYRAAGGHGVWDDGGVASVREFFRSLSTEARHRELLKAWDSNIPEDPQDWGYGKIDNLAIHTSLTFHKMLDEERRVETADVSLRPAAAREGRDHSVDQSARSLTLTQAAKSPVAPPGMVLIYLDPQPRVPKGRVDRRRQLFTGASGDGPGTDTKFEVRVRPLPEGSRCLMFLLLPELVEELARVLGRPPMPESDEDVVGTLCEAVSPRSLGDGLGPSEDATRAADIAEVLAFAPSLYLVAGSSGIDRTVLLGEELPTLPLGSIVMVCVVPSRTVDTSEEEL